MARVSSTFRKPSLSAKSLHCPSREPRWELMTVVGTLCPSPHWGGGYFRHCEALFLIKISKRRPNQKYGAIYYRLIPNKFFSIFHSLLFFHSSIFVWNLILFEEFRAEEEDVHGAFSDPKPFSKFSVNFYFFSVLLLFFFFFISFSVSVIYLSYFRFWRLFLPGTLLLLVFTYG